MKRLAKLEIYYKMLSINNKKKLFRVLPHILASCAILVMVPMYAHALDNGTQASTTGFIPCNGYEKVEDGGIPCDFNQAIVLINNIVEFLFKIVLPLVVVFVVIYSGWLFLTKGSQSEARTKAKNMLLNILIGTVIALCAYLIVKTILKTLGYVAPAGLDFISTN